MHYTVCDYLLDLVQNSIEAESDRIDLVLNESPDHMLIILRDNGKGMDADELKRVRDPFYTDGRKHRNRKVGLGIPFLEQVIQLTHGELQIDSEKGWGTEIQIKLPQGNIDSPPLGDLPSLLQQCFCFDGEYDFSVQRTLKNGEQYTVSRNEMWQILGDLNLSGIMVLLREFLISQESVEETL